MTEAVLSAPAIKPKVSRDDWTMRAFIGVIGLYLVVTLAMPLYTMMSKSVRDHDGVFVGFANYIDYFSTPALTYSIWNSLQVASITTFITVTIGFTFAYALTRSCIPLKGLFQSITMIPILVPSLLPGIALVYLFGTQGLIRELMFGHSIYGPIGIVIAEVFFTLPHAHHHPDHLTVHRGLPPVRGRGSAAGEPAPDLPHRHASRLPLRPHQRRVRRVHPVDHRLRRTQGHRRRLQRAGHRRLQAGDRAAELRDGRGGERGAPDPAALAFAVDRVVQRRQVALLSSRAVALEPKPNRTFDATMLGFCWVVSVFLLGMLGTCQYAALVKFYPYNLSWGLQNYDFDVMDAEDGAPTGTRSVWRPTRRSSEPSSLRRRLPGGKGPRLPGRRTLFQFLAMMPMAVPGLVLGLAYIFFFNHPNNPLGFLYHTWRSW